MATPAYKLLYGTTRWYRLRWHQLQQQPLCTLCAQLGKLTEAVVVDHMTPHRGNQVLFFDPNNLQSLCKCCHDGTKQQMEKSGVLRGCDSSGLPLDSNHHWNRLPV